MEWEELVAAAGSSIAYIGTADRRGAPHVAVVMPGLVDGALWFVTRRHSRKYRNLEENPEAAFHWPVDGGGPGELIARGAAELHPDEGARRELWGAGKVAFDLDAFFGGPDNPDVAFVEVPIRRARLLTADFRPHVYSP